MDEQMCNFQKKIMEIIKMSQMKVLKIKSMMAKRKNSFNRLISRPYNTAQKRIFELEPK